ncbi:MAG TPA: LamG domain-containing protein [Gemmataceae bacterium]|jgi:hypothetical protein|nr:LamG domain-containing protein [Gemmataceae bacterium]
MDNQHWSRRDFLTFAGAAGLAAVPGMALAGHVPPAGEAGHSAYARAVLADAPVAYWRLGERRGRSAHDATGHGRHARYVGPVEFGQTGAIAADPDRTVRLDGPRSKAHVRGPDGEPFSVAGSGRGMTVEVWMRPDVLEFRGEKPDPKGASIHWLGKGEKGHYEWGFRFYSRRSGRPNRISAYVWNPEGKLGAGAYVEDRLTARAWVYLVATFDDPRKPNARVQLYKDGKPSPHNRSPGTLYKSYGIRPEHGRAPVRLGTRDLRGFLTGGLDEVAIYPRVLTAEEVRHHWRLARGERGP